MGLSWKQPICKAKVRMLTKMTISDPWNGEPCAMSVPFLLLSPLHRQWSGSSLQQWMLLVGGEGKKMKTKTSNHIFYFQFQINEKENRKIENGSPTKWGLSFWFILDAVIKINPHGYPWGGVWTLKSTKDLKGLAGITTQMYWILIPCQSQEGSKLFIVK